MNATDLECPPPADSTPVDTPPQPGLPQGAIFPGRFTAEYGDELVVFLVGFRLNGVRGLLSALQTFTKMPAMLFTLERKPELGCLGGHIAFGWLTAYVIQYWRSYDDLERFAHMPAEAHLPAWRWYARLGKKGSGSGVWHETFRVAPGASEAIYVNMPRFGLAKATAHRSLAGGSTSRRRISE